MRTATDLCRPFLMLIHAVAAVSLLPAPAQASYWYAYFGSARTDVQRTPIRLAVAEEISHPIGSPVDISPDTCGYMSTFYRTHNEQWVDAPGFYWTIFLPPFVPPQSQTWDGIYAWAQGAGVPAGLVQYSFYGIGSRLGPGASAELVLDYVPAELDYAGPWTFPIDVYSPQGTLFDIPVPNVSDPLLGTRMHITVTVVPEPSSLLALSAGLAGMVGAVRRAGGRLHRGL